MVSYITCLSLLLASNSVDLKDPTKPLLNQQKPKQAVGLIDASIQKPSVEPLKSIFIFGDIKQALIGNTLYREGDRYQHYKIKKIDNNMVLLSSKHSVKKLYLFPQVFEKSRESNE